MTCTKIAVYARSRFICIFKFCSLPFVDLLVSYIFRFFRFDDFIAVIGSQGSFFRAKMSDSKTTEGSLHWDELSDLSSHCSNSRISCTCCSNVLLTLFSKDLTVSKKLQIGNNVCFPENLPSFFALNKGNVKTRDHLYVRFRFLWTTKQPGIRRIKVLLFKLCDVVLC